MAKPKISKVTTPTDAIPSGGNPVDSTPATIDEILGATSTPETPSLSEEETELLAIEKQREAILGNVKLKLAKSLSAACDSYRLLLKLGQTNVLKEPMFYDFCNTLHIEIVDTAKVTSSPVTTTPTQPPVEKKTRGPRATGGMTIGGAILQALGSKDEKGNPVILGIPALWEQVKILKGSEVPKQNISQALLNLKKKNQVESQGTGLYQLKEQTA